MTAITTEVEVQRRLGTIHRILLVNALLMFVVWLPPAAFGESTRYVLQSW